MGIHIGRNKFIFECRSPYDFGFINGDWPLVFYSVINCWGAAILSINNGAAYSFTCDFKIKFFRVYASIFAKFCVSYKAPDGLTFVFFSG